MRNGQSVEIITAQGQNPQPTWLDMTETGKAKTAIRRALREVDKERMVVMGKALLQTAFEHIGKRATDKSLELAASKMRLSDSKELLARVGSTEVRPGHVVRLVHPEVTSADDFDVDKASAVIGLHEGQFLDRRPCCGPLPGERIVGIASGGSGVAIHAIAVSYTHLRAHET